MFKGFYVLIIVFKYTIHRTLTVVNIDVTAKVYLLLVRFVIDDISTSLYPYYCLHHFKTDQFYVNFMCMSVFFTITALTIIKNMLKMCDYKLYSDIPVLLYFFTFILIFLFCLTFIEAKKCGNVQLL